MRVLAVIIALNVCLGYLACLAMQLGFVAAWFSFAAALMIMSITVVCITKIIAE